MQTTTAKVVCYKRVSRQSQGLDGLGMAAQAKLLTDYIAANSARVMGEFEEVKSGLKDRPALRAAIAKAKATRSVLLIAKLDRAGRRASEVLTLLDRSDVKVVFADMPHASDLQLGIMAVVAQEEARAISVRTKAALAAARANGTELGGPLGIAPLAAYGALHGNVKAIEGAKAKAQEFACNLAAFVSPYITSGMSDAAIAEQLNADGVETRREGGRWHRGTVARLRARLAN
ncbi:MAG: recombinase family protein [Minisyncoccia bacterium]